MKALKKYARRKAGLENPDGTYSTRGRWTPAPAEARALEHCGYRAGTPMDWERCKTLEHCEALEGVPIGSTYHALKR